MAKTRLQRRQLWLVLAFGVGLVVAGLAGSGCGGAQLPTGATLAVSSGPIIDFARDGKRIAWRTSQGRIVVEDLRTKSRRSIPSYHGQRVALADNRILWTVDHEVANTECELDLNVLTLDESSSVARRVWHASGGERDNDRQCRSQIAVAGEGSGFVVRRGEGLAIVGARSTRPLIGTSGVVAFAASEQALAFGRVVQAGCACENASSPAWSPDGSRIAFLSEPSITSPPYESDLEVMPADGGAVSAVARDRTGLASPTWSPDGRRLAFVRNDDALGLGLYIVNADGTNEHRLATVGFGAWDPKARWSPDGKSILYVGFDPGLSGVRVLEVDGTHRRWLTRRRDPVLDATWSPQGDEIAVVRHSRLSSKCVLDVMNADGSAARRIATLPLCGVRLAWSLNGRYVALEAWSDDSPSIYLMRWPKGSLTRLVRGTDPSWSPDSRQVTFSRCSPTSCGDRQDISVVNVDGTGEKQLTRPNAGNLATEVTVEDPNTRRPLRSFTVPGAAVALAFSRSLVAVLKHRGGTTRLSVYAAASGRPMASTSVAGAASELSTDETLVAFRIGRTIRIFDPRTEEVQSVAVTEGVPIGLSIERGRIMWAENAHGRGSVKELVLRS